jgi:DNA-binding LacI/PurR family transcriptional regulator/DNA-binding transcriptional regulator YhcF (GntR family)
MSNTFRKSAAMPASGNNRAIDIACDFLKRNSNKDPLSSDISRLSIRTLANMAGVSRGTMFNAIGLLRKNGVIKPREPRSFKVGSKNQTSAGATQQTASWQRKRMLLEQEILAGHFGLQGRLPSKKELQSRYGICFRTMHKILQAMADDGVIRPHGKGYALPAATSRASGQRIIFITCIDHATQVSALNKEHNQIVNVFENESMRLGLHLEIVEIDFYDSAKSRIAIAKLANDDLVSGFIVDLWWYPIETFRQSYIGAFMRLAAFRKPVAILDEAGNFTLPVQFLSNPMLQVFCIESKRAGERMARLLLNLGHSSIVYLSIVHQDEWSQKRFEGVKAQFLRAGCSDNGIHLVCNSGILTNMPCLLTASGLEDEDVRRLIAVGNTPSQTANLESIWLDFKKHNKPPYAGYPQLSSNLKTNIADFAHLMRKKSDALFYDKSIDGVISALEIHAFEINIKPLFKKALAFHDATAWICANDATAFSAISFLGSQDIHIPNRLSVVGFDNTPIKALEQQLTSFDFNAQGFVSRMLNFIVRPPKPRGHYRHCPIEVEGIIIERRSTGRAVARAVMSP